MFPDVDTRPYLDHDCIASMSEPRISLTMREGWALRSLKMFSTTEISVEVVSSPQNADLRGKGRA